MNPTDIKKRLIIFSRYPEPGKTKTRMIPALGAQGAAELQRQMTEHTLAQAKKLTKLLGVAIEVHFAGGNQQLITNWLGQDLVYQPQSSGDLGQRMTSAFTEAFMAKMESVVMIGIDCPDLNENLLSQAFESLNHHDLVLGPAQDGGYYLIGLGRNSTELLNNISWGTDQVLAQTVAKAKQLDFTIAYLDTLSDVDRPEDLVIWESLAPYGQERRKKEAEIGNKGKIITRKRG